MALYSLTLLQELLGDKELIAAKERYKQAKRLSLAKQPILSVVNEHLVQYPAPTNLTYLWGYGSTAGICLLIQIVTGIFLAMHYTAHVDLAFVSVEHIMRDVQGGWLLRYMHANGASFFFIVVYIHMFRGLYFVVMLVQENLFGASV